MNVCSLFSCFDFFELFFSSFFLFGFTNRFLRLQAEEFDLLRDRNSKPRTTPIVGFSRSLCCDRGRTLERPSLCDGLVRAKLRREMRNYFSFIPSHCPLSTALSLTKNNNVGTTDPRNGPWCDT